jgi:hypothetical protein
VTKTGSVLYSREPALRGIAAIFNVNFQKMMVDLGISDFHKINTDICPTKKNGHRRLSISVQRTNVHRKGVWSVLSTPRRTHSLASSSYIYHGTSFSGSVTEKVFDNYGCRFAFRASEPVETCEFFLSSYARFSKEQAAIVII